MMRNHLTPSTVSAPGSPEKGESRYGSLDSSVAPDTHGTRGHGYGRPVTGFRSGN